MKRMVLGLFCAGLVFCVAAQDFSPIKPRLAQGFELSTAERMEYDAGAFLIRLFARRFSQGNVVYVEIVPATDTLDLPPGLILLFNGKPVHLSARDWGARGFFPLAADETPGKKELVVRFSGNGNPLKQVFQLPVSKTPFPESRSKMDVGRFSDVHHARDPQVQRYIEECSRKKRKAFDRHGPDRLAGGFAHPRCVHHITSPFWSTRIYERFEIREEKRIEHPPSIKVHRGIDLRGKRGDPVFALAAGEVILAEEMYYEGKFTVIDHGNRIMSYYMHQDSILVTAGQLVEAGDMIGTVGNTGISTAPHLHVSLVIDGVQVDPLSVLFLPVRQESAQGSRRKGAPSVPERL